MPRLLQDRGIIVWHVKPGYALDPGRITGYHHVMLAMEQISRMSSNERIEAMEILWQSFAKEGLDYPSPDWHGKVLAERSEIIDSGKASWLSVDDLQARLLSR